MRRIILITLTFFFSTQKGSAQIDSTLVGNCATGVSEAYLDINNVRARIPNNGVLFYRGSPDVYEVPKGSGLKAIFSASLWVGGLVNDELRVAGSTYGPYEFWPGPIETPGVPPTDCISHDRVWSFDLAYNGFIANSPRTISKDMREWPVEAGAPFINVHGGPEYEPRRGDHPLILGRQMHWWIMNDTGNLHKRTRTNPLGIEIQVSAFAFDSVALLKNVTFYRYHITNKNVLPIREMYVGQFADVDLGAAFDDWVGTDSTLSLVYAYNADNDDDGNYGIAPPAVGIATIEVSHSEGGLPSDGSSDLGDFMTRSMFFNGGGGIQGDPGNGADIYNYLLGNWKDGSPLTLGGNGFGFSGTQANYMFPGDPASQSFWTEHNTGGAFPNAPADRRIVGSYGPFDLDPGDSVTFTYAYVWARGTSNLDSVTQLKELTQQVHAARNGILQPLPDDFFFQFVDGNLPDRPQQSFWMDPVYPNPSNGATTIKYSLSLDGPSEIAVFDVLSRKVATLARGFREAGPHEASFDTSDLRPGVYTIRLESNRHVTSRLLTVVR